VFHLFLTLTDTDSLRRVRRNAKQQKRSRTLLAEFGAMRVRCELREEDRRLCGGQGMARKNPWAFGVDIRGARRAEDHTALGPVANERPASSDPRLDQEKVRFSPKVVSFLAYLYKSLPGDSSTTSCKRRQ
jgi:hypothetical protein